jgi:hypothetical protein
MSSTRRTVLRLLAGSPLLALGPDAEAREPMMPGLIEKARGQGGLSQRIDFISRALLGTRYQAYTLVGGPRRPEQFVLRDDAFDCVTYCEAVLAAALAQDYAEYPNILRRIRYAGDEVRWAARNHDFAQWNRSVVAKGICHPVGIAPAVTVEKTIEGNGLGRRHYAFSAITTPVLLTQGKALQAGDVIGFVSRRSDLDFFHTGLIAFGPRGALLVRHASQSQGRTVSEEMTSFVARTGVRFVTLVRAQETALAGVVR